MNRLTKCLSSRMGKRFLNLAYSWGACLVILGAIFKISHYPYDDVFLMVGMCTEVLIFFISGFDEPSREYKWEKVFPGLNNKGADAGMEMPGVSSACQEKMVEMEKNLDKINKTYEKQLQELSHQVETIGNLGSGFEKMKDICDNTIEQSSAINSETQQVSEKLGALSSQYTKMLDVMNISAKKK